MLQVERYVFRTAAYAFLAGLTALTGIVWVTQALRQVDLLTNKGQSLLVFLSITGLTTPSLVAIIAPVALFVNQQTGDIGFSPWAECPGRHWHFRDWWNSLWHR